MFQLFGGFEAQKSGQLAGMKIFYGEVRYGPLLKYSRVTVEPGETYLRFY